MAEDQKYIIRGYSFETEEEAKKAGNEFLKIKKIEEKVDYKNPQVVLSVYQKLVEKSYFETVVGYEYLRKLQRFLLNHEETHNLVTAIPVFSSELQSIPVKVETKSKPIVKTVTKNNPFFVYTTIILLVMVIALVVISFTSNRPTILNYERTIQNKYSEWEQELMEREAVVKEKERELKLTE